MTRPVTVLMLALAFPLSTTLAADPPMTINYQGVLRDAANKPRNGTIDMVFRFHSAPGGPEILVDIHPVVNVTNGLFNVQLGGGTVVDGSGPGTYTSLDLVFRDHGFVWMGITIGGEMLLPMIKVESSPYALNASNLQGRPASEFLDTSSNYQSKYGPVSFNSASTTDPAVRAAATATGAYAYLGANVFGVPTGVEGYAPTTGGFFHNDEPSYAALGYNARGIEAVGSGTGGAFENYSFGGRAYVGHGRTGIEAFGISPSAAGHFLADGNAGEAFLGLGNTGILARGNDHAGQFNSSGSLRNAYLGSDAYATGGYFENLPAGLWVYLAADFGTGLLTNGPKNFVQNHPARPDRAIVYTALEGPEAGTYTRGRATLRGGESRIALDSTFALTTDPDIGLTAVVTPRGAHADLYVASISTRELVVRSASLRDGDVEFDYLVNGLRAGFENAPVLVRNSSFPSATVPGFEVSEARLAAEPEDVRASTPRARFSAGGDAVGPRRAVSPSPEAETRLPDLAGTRALIAGINSPDHAAHARAVGAVPAPATSDAIDPSPRIVSAGGGDRRAPAAVPVAEPAASSATPADRPAPTDAVSGFAVMVGGTVEAGDVLANDATHPGVLRRSDFAADAGVVGVVAGRPGASFSGPAQLAPAGSVAFCKAEATARSIGVNDLLVASSIPGHAMSGGADPRQGTVIGKALEPLESGAGVIRILVMSR